MDATPQRWVGQRSTRVVGGVATKKHQRSTFKACLSTFDGAERAELVNELGQPCPGMPNSTIGNTTEGQFRKLGRSRTQAGQDLRRCAAVLSSKARRKVMFVAFKRPAVASVVQSARNMNDESPTYQLPSLKDGTGFCKLCFRYLV